MMLFDRPTKTIKSKTNKIKTNKIKTNKIKTNQNKSKKIKIKNQSNPFYFLYFLIDKNIN